MKKRRNEETMRLGVHVSISGGIEEAVPRAIEIGCTSFQIFSRNPRVWKSHPLPNRSIAEFRKRAVAAAIDPIVIHTPYLLNLASGDGELYRRSISGLALDVQRAEQLGARFVVTHLGSFRENSRDFGLQRIAGALREILKKETPVFLLLENAAGAGRSLGSRFAELREIIASAGGSKHLGVCFDACHGFAAGYDLRTPAAVAGLAREIGRTIGGERLALLHLNDCSGDLGSHLDRHAHIGRGKIGAAGFRNLLQHPLFRGLPMILETPKDHPDADLRNMMRIKKIYFAPPILAKEGEERE